MVIRKMSWLHPAHGEKKNGLIASSPLRKEKWAGCIQPMEKKKNGLVASSPWNYRPSRKERWTGFKKRRKRSRSIGDIRTGKKLRGFTWKCVYLSQSLV